MEETRRRDEPATKGEGEPNRSSTLVGIVIAVSVAVVASVGFFTWSCVSYVSQKIDAAQARDACIRGVIRRNEKRSRDQQDYVFRHGTIDPGTFEQLQVRETFLDCD